MISIEEIQCNIKKWTFENVDPNFEFRPGQFEAIVDIVNSIVNVELQTNIIQAPTGTGKSFICIISAGVLATYYNKKSYILASDLYLWQQYQEAIVKFKLRDFGFLKGSLGNYICEMNMSTYDTGECKQKRVSLKQFRIKDDATLRKYPCAHRCPYLVDRFRAEKTPVTLLTYQLWLYQMNLVNNEEESNGFIQRDVIFCDECHNIPDIISRFAQPSINAYHDRMKIMHIIEYAINNGIAMPSFSPEFMYPEIINKYPSAAKFEDAGKIACVDALSLKKVLDAFDYVIDSLNGIYKDIPADNRVRVKVDLLVEFCKVTQLVAEISERCLEHLSKFNNTVGNQKWHGKSQQDSGDKNVIASFKELNWMHNYSSAIGEFLHAIQEAGQEYVVMEKSLDKVNQCENFTFFCVKEDYLCRQYLLSKSKYKVMTSATVGNIESYITNIGVDWNEVRQNPTQIVAYKTLPNIFDFSQSPIYILNDYKMNYAEKRTSLPKIQEIVYSIINAYPNIHGMINTGSYEIAEYLYNNAPKDIKKRLCKYDNAKDKDKQIKLFKNNADKIMIGPTLVEGVDLPGDLCRFIIIVKLPYPNVSSPLIKSKMQLFPLWYNSTTSNIVIQNIGRGVRFQGDWCYTFILDGCFKNLYNNTYTQYSPEIQARLQIVNPQFFKR